MGSVLGSKLNGLSMENGQISLNAGAAHSKQAAHLGSFLNIRLMHKTARISQPAVMLMFNSCKKTVLIFIAPLPGRSSCGWQPLHRMKWLNPV